MALLKSAQQMSCPHCQAANPHGSPYCVRCGAPLGDIQGPSALASAQTPQSPSRFSTPVLHAETPHFQDSFLSEGQDPILAKSTFERAIGIMIAGETIEYVATANRAVGHMPDCVVATNKRIMLYKKRTFGKLELDDMFWRDLEGVQMKEGRNGVLLIIDSIQGWQIIAESLPKSQAWRLNEFAQKYSERLTGKLQEAMASLPSQAVPAPQVPLTQVAPTPAPNPQASATPSPVAPSAPRQYIYTAQSAAPSAQPAQAAAFHAQPPAQAEVVVFDTQATHPVLREPTSAGPSPAPGPAPAPAPVAAQSAPARPASGPLAQPHQSPSPARPSAMPAAGVPTATTPAHASAPIKAIGPLPAGQPQMHAHVQTQPQPKLGSGPLSSRLSQAPAPPASSSASQRSFTTSPIFDPPGAYDDPVRKMKQLKDMLEADLITREEFEAKKAEILARM